MQVLETHDFSTGMLQEKMKENERRRKRTSIGMDPELTQYLEDERLAIMLQNSEFLQELRGNEDFMQTLERGKYTVKKVIFLGLIWDIHVMKFAKIKDQEF